VSILSSLTARNENKTLNLRSMQALTADSKYETGLAHGVLRSRVRNYAYISSGTVSGYVCISGPSVVAFILSFCFKHIALPLTVRRDIRKSRSLQTGQFNFWDSENSQSTQSLRRNKKKKKIFRHTKNTIFVVNSYFSSPTSILTD
jgi:hypothetical protein